MNTPPLRQPSALLPIAMSLAALAPMLGHAAIYGIVHEADEGTAAHLFQLLMLLQVPIALYFAAIWLPRRPGDARRVLAMQALAGMLALAAVFLLT